MANLSVKTGVISRSMLVGNPGYVPPAFESIASGTPTGSSFDFTSIPSTYKHLQVRINGRLTSTGSPSSGFVMKINADSTAANYRYHYLQSNGATVSAFSDINQFDLYSLPTADAASNIFGTVIIDIIDYASTTKNKTLRWSIGNDRNGAGTMSLGSGLYISTVALSEINFSTSSNFASGTVFSLYGIKG
jgi:hypothetical protein